MYIFLDTKSIFRISHILSIRGKFLAEVISFWKYIQFKSERMKRPNQFLDEVAGRMEEAALPTCAEEIEPLSFAI